MPKVDARECGLWQTIDCNSELARLKRQGPLLDEHALR
jgi:hypothetical protein